MFLDLDGYTQGALKVNYTISPPGYQADNAQVILVENGIGLTTVSGTTTGTGSAVFPRGMNLDINKKYEVYVVLNCNPPNTKVSERKEVKVNLIPSCKVKVNGVLVNLDAGARSTDGGSCCYEGDLQQKNPITDLEKCPKRESETNWITKYDGCSYALNNPAGGHETSFSSPICRATQLEADCNELPCDRHDKCYQTCETLKNLFDGQKACDDHMKEDMSNVCE